jgi:carboxymethylenebutenolidase
VSADPKGLGATFDAHTDAEFKTRDIGATMAAMGDAPHLTHVPTMTGGNGRENVRRFHETWFIGHWPKDTSINRISRTVDEGHIVDEIIVSFTHDCEIPAIVPGVPPTGRKVVLPMSRWSASRTARSLTSTSGTRRRCSCRSAYWISRNCR